MSNNEYQLEIPCKGNIEHAREQAKKQRERIMKHSMVSQEKFLNAWLRGVRVIGWVFFKNHKPHYMSALPEASCIEEVTDKWQVCPDSEYICQNIDKISSGEKALLSVMCSFFNSSWGGDLMHEIGINGMADISNMLDMDSTEIISELLIYYNGW